MKLKTRKSIAKRFWASGAKAGRGGRRSRLIRKTAGQDHFNAREPGTVTLQKRRSRAVHSADERNIRRLVPYV
jgi:ribosomal protein L35